MGGKIYKELEELLGTESAGKLCKEYGGEMTYIPKYHKQTAKTRDELIFAEYNGHNAPELARFYGVSKRTVYRAIEKNKTARIKA